MHVLVTGGAGFIGTSFVRMLLRDRPSYRVTNFDALTYSGNLENLTNIESDERYTFVKGDVRDAALLDEVLPGVDAVVHMAAESHVDRSIMDSGPFVDSNTRGTQVLLDAWRRAHGNDKRFLYVSTDEVYGTLPLDDKNALFTEETPLQTNSPYSASKAGGDLMVRAYHHTHGMDVVTTRCSNNFGPWQFPEKVIPLFVTNLLDGKKVPLYGDGRNVRDWLHVEDHCEAVLTVLEKGRSGEVYNVGGNNERSNLELTHSILSIMGHGDEMIEYVKDRPGHDLRYAIDASKIKDELGWEPTRSVWPGALEDTVRWYSESRFWWERVRSGAYQSYYETQYG
ncbi:MAG: dTDP-glucose 4,6-dehydratase [Planctomycetota bacterium]